MTDHLATILIPVLNEAADIRVSLRSVLAQDYPHEMIEIIVVDGGSTDDTPSIVRKELDGGAFVRVVVVSNPVGSTPSNLNAGLAVAEGTVLCRVDARSSIPPDYVRRCVELLCARPEVKVVGGAQVARPRDRSARSLGIARALNNRYGMGLARYRRGARSGPADTVYLGAFRTDDLRRANGWDERFETNQDFELNRRLGREGVVWFESELEVEYLPRETLSALVRQYHRFGRWKAVYWLSTGDRPRPRQVALLSGPLVLGISAVAAARRSPRTAAGAVAFGVISAPLIERRGADLPDCGPGGHLVAIGALGGVACAWFLGVVRGMAGFIEVPPRGGAKSTVAT